MANSTLTTMATSPPATVVFPDDIIKTIGLNWNVMTLSVVNTVLLVLNLVLVLVLIYAVYANSRKVIRFVKNYVRFYSQVLSPPEKFLDSIEMGSLSKTEGTSSSSSGTSERSRTNMSNYSTTESHNEIGKMAKSIQTRPIPLSALGGKLAVRPTNSHLRSKIERTKNKAVAMAGELSLLTRSGSGRNVSGLEREASSESLRLKMKRSESWDAKNKIYSNSSYLSVAEKNNRIGCGATYNFDF